MDFRDYDTRVGAYALIFDGDSVLLTWWNGNGRPDWASWALPGGGVELGEQVEGAVIREVFEETGFRIELDDYLTTHSWARVDEDHPRPFNAVRIVFTAHIVGGTLGVVEVGGTTDRAEWVPLDRLDEIGPRGQLVDVALDTWRRRS